MQNYVSVLEAYIIDDVAMEGTLDSILNKVKAAIKRFFDMVINKLKDFARWFRSIDKKENDKSEGSDGTGLMLDIQNIGNLCKNIGHLGQSTMHKLATKKYSEEDDKHLKEKLAQFDIQFENIEDHIKKTIDKVNQQDGVLLHAAKYADELDKLVVELSSISQKIAEALRDAAVDGEVVTAHNALMMLPMQMLQFSTKIMKLVESLRSALNNKEG